jgi:hypothetical protein
MKSYRFIFGLLILILFCSCGGGGGSSASYLPISNPDPVTDPETASFWAYDFVRNRYYTLSAAKVAEGVHCYVYLEDGESVAQDAIDAVKNEFDTKIYPSVTTAFGSEPNPGVDGDSKIYILLQNVIDGFTTGSSSYIAGYFNPLNEYSVPNSNKKEMFYMNINPAPGIVAGDADFNDTLAHEFQHMIHWEQKTHLKGLNNPTWLNEAMSTIAGTYCGYGPSWYSVRIYEADPSNSLTMWDSTPYDYGVAYMWAQYFKDHYTGNGNIFKEMLDQNSTGITSVNAALTALGYSKNFNETFRDLSIAVFSGSTYTWPGHPEWSYVSIDTWPGSHGEYDLPGLFPDSRQNVNSLAPLEAYSMNFYRYSPTGSITWTSAGDFNYASFVDSGASAIAFDMTSDTPYAFTTYGYLIEQQTEGSSASGGTVVSSSIMLNPLKLADVELVHSLKQLSPKSPRQILAEVNDSPVVKKLVAMKGKKYPVRMDSFFVEQEKELRKTGVRPSF